MVDLQDEIARLEGQLDPTRASVIDELTKVRTDLSRPGARRSARLADLRIASPCQERWADMTGDDRVRVCNGCERPVFDLSEMTRAEAEAVLATRGVKPCVRFYRRADGTIMTADCGRGERRKVRIAAVAAGTVLLGASPAMADPALAPPVVDAPHATTGAVRGIVRDADTGEPLAGVTIVITGPTGMSENAISDEDGSYQLTSLPPGDGYVATFYSGDLTVERTGITVSVGRTTPVFVTLKTDDAGGDVDLETFVGSITTSSIPRPGGGHYTMGLPPSTSSDGYGVAFAGAVEDDVQEEVGIIVDPTAARRPLIEWSTWARVGVGTESRASDVVARSITPPPRAAERHATLEAALGAELTLPIALHGELRVGAWTEVRTSSGPVLGGELQLPGVSIRAGGNADVITGAVAYGHRAPWSRWGPWDGATRYMIGARVVASVTRSVDDPRAWTATAGLELEPAGALRYVLRRVRSAPF